MRNMVQKLIDLITKMSSIIMLIVVMSNWKKRDLETSYKHIYKKWASNVQFENGIYGFLTIQKKWKPSR